MPYMACTLSLLVLLYRLDDISIIYVNTFNIIKDLYLLTELI
jgi:hypothetical protein